MKNTFKLTKKVNINGKEADEIEYDLDELTAEDIDIALQEVMGKGHTVLVQETDQVLNAAIFARSAGLGVNDLKVLSARDYLKAGSLVRNFLYIDSAKKSTEIS